MNWEEVIGCVEILLEAGDEGPALTSACPNHSFPRDGGAFRLLAKTLPNRSLTYHEI